MKVVVVGAGLSGLFTASEIAARGGEVTLVEGSEHLGGVCRTVEVDGFLLEPAAGTFLLPHPVLGPIVERSGTEVEPVASTDRYIFDGERLHQVSPRMLAGGLLPLPSVFRALAEPLVPSRPVEEHETFEELFIRRLGRRAGALAAWLAATGVYAGDPRALSATSAFPALATLVADHGSLLGGALSRMRQGRGRPRPRPHLPVAGMTALARGVAATLKGRVHTGFKVEGLARSGQGWVVSGPEDLVADRVVLAVGAADASRLVDPELATVLRRAHHAPVAVVWLGARGGEQLPPGFGALTTRDGVTFALGYLFESSYAPNRAPDGGWLVKAMVGGATRPEAVDLDDATLVARIGDELSRILGGPAEPTTTLVVRHHPGIPQYRVGHRAWLEEIAVALEARPGLHLTGWSYRGVGVSQIAGDAARTAEAVIG